jgi:hypothetical protein
MITIPTPFPGMLCDECFEPLGEWCATATCDPLTICLTCFTEVWFTIGYALRSTP